MKLVKLSLAAIVAAGALTSVASAASLEEAIKNVDVTGYARYRFDSKDNGSDTANKHRFTSDVNFKSALDDNFFGVLGFRYDSIDNSGERFDARTMVGANDNGNDNFGQTFNVRQVYLGYTAGNTTITAGRQVLGTFFTDDMVGTGIKLLNSDISGLTLAAVAFDNLQDDGDIGTSALELGSNGGEYVYDRNLYGAAAIGSYDPVSFQLWYAALDSVAQLYAADVTVGANLGGVDLSLQAQVAGSSMWADNASLAGVSEALDDATFWAAELGAKAFGFDASVGYVQFDSDEISLISFEDQGSFIDAGEDLLNYTAFAGDNKYWFLTAGYTFADKVRVGADYVAGEGSNGVTTRDVDRYEAVARVDYKYSKKLNFKAWYSYINQENGQDDAKHLRFEARYNF
ncbi:porin [Campylobacter vicugnae]|uniref:porin n=1 Tax=Campylobacter vicugnae TaxID=1660076 RepID=UPI00254BE5FE|nr:porin [Campylobacter ovis]MDL0105075.1 major outer membrane protein [Campylobacter ovis]MDL0106494.1 major outer membrane protein [Campylobacter ovis]